MNRKKAKGKRQQAKGSAGGDGARSAAGLLFLLPLGFCLCSCAALPELPWAPQAKDAQAGFYQTARLEYRIDAGKLGQPLDVVRVDGIEPSPAGWKLPVCRLMDPD